MNKSYSSPYDVYHMPPEENKKSKKSLKFIEDYEGLQESYNLGLREAAAHFNIEGMGNSIGAGAQLDSCDPLTGHSILQTLMEQVNSSEAESKCIDCINMLVKKEPNIVDYTNAEGQTGLFCAISTGRKNLIDCLLTNGADRYSKFKGKTAFQFAIFSAHLIPEKRESVLAYLQTKGLRFESDIFEKAYQGDVDYLQKIPKADLLNFKDSAGHTVKDYASANNKTEVCALYNGFQKETQSSQPVASSSTPNSYSKVHRTLVIKAVYDDQTQSQITKFFDQIIEGRDDLIPASYLSLTNNGINPFELTYEKTGLFPIHAAVLYKKNLTLEFFAKQKGFDINADSILAGTALHIAARNGDIELCEWLINHGASLNVLWKDKTPYEVAQIHEKEKLNLVFELKMIENSQSSEEKKAEKDKTQIPISEDKDFKQEHDNKANNNYGTFQLN